ncbi:tRNA (cytosine(32)/uridine(32)-2'-O)-methyltransferase TrmJ [Ectothiorhodospira lacustris]|uniref:tRNA (cytosine(32)/uridine(32)-2'-O)-methyltransferase TrmJ n=1 Tax=Ectothiorhodospira lacustris TaxID=2899127 RepID=UPI001EE7C64F|nr:tRNA (cytosine(32)/uridine(32)-2'-O)-methyltransferase TrmJ [Ectothiorhodospira lacustris]MCG5499804.1 tRNA (cytosine(32)/uridine(32)-2'-O)-methyltransferase TrmJ [Ectothiorhodospira lacustris]MCG5510523.1 tRNA (cytosine(32)/uridine(32)-2'-O)-methyltransferase TrmJ [Ectothiorhodospira lacustris]MCG5522269.1 tRNA (cytosine(32)/uridine(32)-2'-O)-methyltransferase TrmJ [Ectothiorhodospira lacustris]
MELLNPVRIVLVNTSHPGNVGGVARAMKNMGLSDLRLVTPQDYPSAEATARASGADDLLARARVVDDLDEALAGCRLVLGTSARQRTLRWPELDPRQAAARLLEVVPTGPVAVLFGRERTGLTNEELDRCQALIHIPANPEYSSLNLAAAVQVLSYELRMAALAHAPASAPAPTGGELPASHEELERLYAHLEETLLLLEFLDPDNPRHLMRRLRRLFAKADPTINEVNILRGILTQAAKGPPEHSGKP